MGLVRQVVDTLALPVVTRARVRSGRRHRDPGRAGGDAGDDVIDRHRRPGQLPAGRGPARPGPLQPAWRLRLRPLRRGRHRRAHRRAPRSVRVLRRAAGRPLRQPAGHPRGRGEDRREAGERATATSTASSPHTDEQTPEAPREPGRARGAGSVERRDDAPGPRRRRSRSTPTSSSRATFDPDAVLELFRFLEFPSLVPRLAEAFPERFGDAGAARLPAVEVLEAEVTESSNRNEAVEVLAALGGLDTVAVAAAWAGDPGRSRAASAWPSSRDRAAAEVAWLPVELVGRRCPTNCVRCSVRSVPASLPTTPSRSSGPCWTWAPT